KRKSWGQVLPEPKTSLPPRKRAKTEDEKEQRRIERIKRNRAAAHTSRERKRLEAEGLAERNDELTKQLAYAIAQIEACKVQLGGSLPQVTQEMVNEQLNGEVFSERRASSTVDPRRSFASSTPEYIDNEDSSCKSETQPTTPLPSHPIEAMVYTSDETQHSAAMLPSFLPDSHPLPDFDQSSSMLSNAAYDDLVNVPFQDATDDGVLANAENFFDFDLFPDTNNLFDTTATLQADFSANHFGDGSGFARV
ncbi:transcription factor that binds to CRE motif, partial [Cryomyces antarcticus]